MTNENINTEAAVLAENIPAEVTTPADADKSLINLDKKQELEETFATIINNPRFWENPNRVKRLTDALIIPTYDDASKRMFYKSAEDELLEREIKAAIKENRVPVAPTQDQIMELAKAKYHDKYVLEPARKAEKAANKKNR